MRKKASEVGVAGQAREKEVRSQRKGMRVGADGGGIDSILGSPPVSLFYFKKSHSV